MSGRQKRAEKVSWTKAILTALRGYRGEPGLSTRAIIDLIFQLGLRTRTSLSVGRQSAASSFARLFKAGVVVPQHQAVPGLRVLYKLAPTPARPRAQRRMLPTRLWRAGPAPLLQLTPTAAQRRAVYMAEERRRQAAAPRPPPPPPPPLVFAPAADRRRRRIRPLPGEHIPRRSRVPWASMSTAQRWKNRPRLRTGGAAPQLQRPPEAARRLTGPEMWAAAMVWQQRAAHASRALPTTAAPPTEQSRGMYIIPAGETFENASLELTHILLLV